MAYLSKCAIHKSSPRIWRKLINFGLHPNPRGMSMVCRNDRNNICTVVYSGVFTNLTEAELDDEIIDCAEDEELFFALAALRDDSDINQWFVYDNRAWNDKDPIYYWFICQQESIESDMCVDAMYEDCEKATEAEIIAHFKGLDDDEQIQ